MTRLLALATGRAVLVGLVVFVAGSGALFGLGPYAQLIGAADGLPLPEEGVTGADGLHRFLEALGPEGREIYRGFQGWDVLNPLLIGLLTVLLVGWLVNRARLGDGAWRRLLWVPFVAPVADLVENGVLWAALNRFPDASPISGLLPIVTTVKFGGLLATVVCVVGLAVVAFRRRRTTA